MADENKVEEAVAEAKEAVAEAKEAAQTEGDAKAEAATDKAKEAVEKVEEAVSQTADSAEETSAVEVPEKFKEVVNLIEQLTVLELAELVKVLEAKFGVSAAPAMVAGGAAAAGGAEAAPEKSAYTIMLESAGEQKINVIKAVREITGLGLAESKAVVDGAPKEVKQDVPKAEAEEALAKLKEAGATASLK